MDIISFGFIMLCYATCAFWFFSMIANLVKAVLKKEKFTFRSTIPFASPTKKGVTSPRKKMIVVLLFPILWMFWFYTSNEHIFQYISRIINGVGDKVDWMYTMVFVISFYLWAGYLAYDGVSNDTETKK